MTNTAYESLKSRKTFIAQHLILFEISCSVKFSTTKVILPRGLGGSRGGGAGGLDLPGKSQKYRGS